MQLKIKPAKISSHECSRYQTIPTFFLMDFLRRDCPIWQEQLSVNSPLWLLSDHDTIIMMSTKGTKQLRWCQLSEWKQQGDKRILSSQIDKEREVSKQYCLAWTLLSIFITFITCLDLYLGMKKTIEKYRFPRYWGISLFMPVHIILSFEVDTALEGHPQ